MWNSGQRQVDSGNNMAGLFYPYSVVHSADTDKWALIPVIYH